MSHDVNAILHLLAGMDSRKAQCHDNRVPGLRLRDTIRVPRISGTRLRSPQEWSCRSIADQRSNGVSETQLRDTVFSIHPRSWEAYADPRSSVQLSQAWSSGAQFRDIVSQVRTSLAAFLDQKPFLDNTRWQQFLINNISTIPQC